MFPAGDSRMEWTLCLVGMETDGQSRSFEVMAISRPDGLGDIANLGLTLPKGRCCWRKFSSSLSPSRPPLMRRFGRTVGRVVGHLT
jgi:hypothetical protein